MAREREQSKGRDRSLSQHGNRNEETGSDLMGLPSWDGETLLGRGDHLVDPSE
jgi:hypothetical protein